MVLVIHFSDFWIDVFLPFFFLPFVLFDIGLLGPGSVDLSINWRIVDGIVFRMLRLEVFLGVVIVIVVVNVFVYNCFFLRFRVVALIHFCCELEMIYKL